MSSSQQQEQQQSNEKLASNGSSHSETPKSTANNTEPKPTAKKPASRTNSGISDTSAASNKKTTTTVKSSSTPTAGPRKSYLEEQEAGVLHDVLVELDRERSKRAELESQVRKLEQNLHTERRKTSNTSSTSHKDFMALKTEVQGYLELLDALTKDRPAFSTKHSKLPIHVIRLLEIIPWDPRARPHLFGQEQVYEWQMYRSDKHWQKELRYFPVFFKTLPIVTPTPGRTVGEAPTSSSPPKQCVLTNTDITQIVNIEKGYPLPQDGGDWQWIGGWRIEKTGDTDEKGWSYSNSPEIMADSSAFYSELRLPEPGTKNIIKRRRKWTRSRVMTDYPHASEMTKQYLKLVAETARLDVTVEKLSNQLVDTKMSLTTLEAEHLALQEQLALHKAKLETEKAEKAKIMEMLDEGMQGAGASALKAAQSATAADAANSATKNSTNKDQAMELRSIVTQWVSNTVSKKQNQDTSAAAAAATTSSNDTSSSTTSTTAENRLDTPASNASRQIMFDSLRGKGRDLFENIKLKGGDEFERIKQTGVKLPPGVKLPWQVKEEKDALAEANDLLNDAADEDEAILDA
eukprot:scaffold473_cov132-Cylindrotheca_fusiformis.AAC.12